MHGLIVFGPVGNRNLKGITSIQLFTTTRESYMTKIIYTPRNQEPIDARKINNQNITHISTLESEQNERSIPLPMAEPHR
jgi:hypothetical protein